MAWFSNNKQNKKMMMNAELSTEGTLIGFMKKQSIAILVQNITHIMIILTLFSFAFYVKHEITLIQHSSQVSTVREADILSQLNDLKSQLDEIKTDHQKISEFKANLDQVQQNMVTQQSLATLAKNADLQQIKAQLAQLKSALSIQQTPQHGKQQHWVKRSVPAKTVLPFKVESLDIMAGQAFASVIYRQQVLPIKLNDSLAGWKAIKIDVNTGLIIWENTKHFHITVTAFRGLYASMAH